MKSLYSRDSSWEAFRSSFWKHSVRNPHRLDEMPKNSPSRLITTHCSADVHWLQESTSFGGHSIPKGGHRRVSGLVRASLKREARRQIKEKLMELRDLQIEEVIKVDQ